MFSDVMWVFGRGTQNYVRKMDEIKGIVFKSENVQNVIRELAMKRISENDSKERPNEVKNEHNS